MITKVVLQNYRRFRHYQLDLEQDINVLVGGNDSGKSTLIEAINLGLTGRIGGRWLSQDFSPFFFNLEATDEYVASLIAEDPEPAPELIIEIYFELSDETAHLRGTNNLCNEDACGVRIRGYLSPDYQKEYDSFISEPDKVRVVPTEYYDVEWVGFSGEPVRRRNVPAVASVIDPSAIRLQSGADYHLQRLIENHLDVNERVQLARQYRSLRESFEHEAGIQEINKKIGGEDQPITERNLTLGLNLSSRFSWENSLLTHIDKLPFELVGKGEQSSLKTLLAIGKKADSAHIVLIEEPENHLSFTALNQLIDRVRQRCEGKQLIIATHSSFVLNKMGIGQLVLLSGSKPSRLEGLPLDTVRYFQKLPGHNTLRMVLAHQVVLVEGPSDELLFERFYFDRHQRRPIEAGIDVISVNSLAFKRYLDLAIALEKPVVVLTDNDGKPQLVAERYASYDEHDFVQISYESDVALKTLEPCVLAANSLDELNAALGKTFDHEDQLLNFMSNNKSEYALMLFESESTVEPPQYFEAALG